LVNNLDCAGPLLPDVDPCTSSITTIPRTSTNIAIGLALVTPPLNIQAKNENKYECKTYQLHKTHCRIIIPVGASDSTIPTAASTLLSATTAASTFTRIAFTANIWKFTPANLMIRRQRIRMHEIMGLDNCHDKYECFISKIVMSPEKKILTQTTCILFRLPRVCNYPVNAVSYTVAIGIPL
jgi:hypothetical protein